MKAVFAIVAILGPLMLGSSVTFAALDTVVLRCEPLKVEEWPNNARVQITKIGTGLQMTVTTNYYQAEDIANFSVTKTSGKIGRAPVDVYQGPDVTLTVSSVPSKGGVAAQLVSQKDGRTELVCHP